jgi:hypothetical protein
MCAVTHKKGMKAEWKKGEELKKAGLHISAQAGSMSSKVVQQAG